MSPKSLTDVHVHMAAFPTPENGCFMSPRMRRSPLFRFFYYRMGLDPAKPEESNRLYVERLASLIRDSRYVAKAVILGMDGIYDAVGNSVANANDFVIPNAYVLQVAKVHPDVFRPGVSINPRRRDAMDELDLCADAGAALVKCLPNAMDMNPADPAFRPFWRRMAERRLPLLSHVGYEFSLRDHDQSVGDPARLIPALEEGVTVIAAHGLSYGLVFYEKYWPVFQDLTRRFPNFYWDCSALSLFNRCGMLLRIRHHPELWPRMVFGTDYPLPVLSLPALLAGRVDGWRELRRIDNPFDRQARLLETLGLPITGTLKL